MATPEVPGKNDKPLPELAHDFHNTIQIIVGNLEILRRHIERDHAVPAAREAMLRPVEAALKAARDAAEVGERLIELGRESTRKPRP